jgi:hypothetical protein
MFLTDDHPTTKVPRQPTNVSCPLLDTANVSQQRGCAGPCRIRPGVGRAARPTGQDVGDFRFPNTRSRSVLER